MLKKTISGGGDGRNEDVGLTATLLKRASFVDRIAPLARTNIHNFHTLRQHNILLLWRSIVCTEPLVHLRRGQPDCSVSCHTV